MRVCTHFFEILYVYNTTIDILSDYAPIKKKRKNIQYNEYMRWQFSTTNRILIPILPPSNDSGVSELWDERQEEEHRPAGFWDTHIQLPPDREEKSLTSLVWRVSGYTACKSYFRSRVQSLLTILGSQTLCFMVCFWLARKVFLLEIER